MHDHGGVQALSAGGGTEAPREVKKRGRRAAGIAAVKKEKFKPSEFTDFMPPVKEVKKAMNKINSARFAGKLNENQEAAMKQYKGKHAEKLDAVARKQIIDIAQDLEKT